MKELIKRYQAILPCKDFIITGSYVVNLLMGINGEIGDLDIILVEPTEEAINSIKRLQESLSPELAPNPDYPAKVYRIMDSGVKVDIFPTNEGKPYIILSDGVKVSTLTHIIKSKKSYNRFKDWKQLRKLSRMFFKEEEFLAFMDNDC